MVQKEVTQLAVAVTGAALMVAATSWLAMLAAVQYALENAADGCAGGVGAVVGGEGPQGGYREPLLGPAAGQQVAVGVAYPQVPVGVAYQPAVV